MAVQSRTHYRRPTAGGKDPETSSHTIEMFEPLPKGEATGQVIMGQAKATMGVGWLDVFSYKAKIITFI